MAANQTVGGHALLDKIGNRAKGRRVEALVVTPALAKSAAQLYAGEIDEAMAEAENRREESVGAIASLGIEVRGEVGDSDPNVTIEDALALPRRRGHHLHAPARALAVARAGRRRARPGRCRPARYPRRRRPGRRGRGGAAQRLTSVHEYRGAHGPH